MDFRFNERMIGIATEIEIHQSVEFMALIEKRHYWCILSFNFDTWNLRVVNKGIMIDIDDIDDEYEIYTKLYDESHNEEMSAGIAAAIYNISMNYWDILL